MSLKTYQLPCLLVSSMLPYAIEWDKFEWDVNAFTKCRSRDDGVKCNAYRLGCLRVEDGRGKVMWGLSQNVKAWLLQGHVTHTNFAAFCYIPCYSNKDNEAGLCEMSSLLQKVKVEIEGNISNIPTTFRLATSPPSVTSPVIPTRTTKRVWVRCHHFYKK